jgi:hypothetical protein
MAGKKLLGKRLPLLPGLKWKGELQVIAMDGARYIVAFNAEVVNPRPGEPTIVYDHASLTKTQLRAWTGQS